MEILDEDNIDFVCGGSGVCEALVSHVSEGIGAMIGGRLGGGWGAGLGGFFGAAAGAYLGPHICESAE